MDDPTASVRDHVLIEDDLPDAMANHRHTPTKLRTVVTDTLKYTRFGNGEEQLFDLEHDPDELTHIGTTDPARRIEMVECLAEALMAAADASRGTPLGAS